MTEFASLAVPGPIPTSVSGPFWDAAAASRFMLQRCDDCAGWIFYPRSLCPHCWSSRLSWCDASGRGTVKSFSVIHRPGHPAWSDVTPYTIALIELDEGPTMLSTLVDMPHESVVVGIRVSVKFVPIGKFMLPMFAPVRDTASDG